MGKYSTGAITTGEAQRIEISYLIKQGWISRGKSISGSLTWTNGNSISIFSKITEGEKYIRLNYQNKRYSGEVNELDYKIQLVSIPSNLGRGEIWYFICPFTGRKARILYKCYGSLYFKSRGAYTDRIYYSCQKASKKYYHFERYFSLENILLSLNSKMKKKHYQGKETRLQERINNLESQLEFHDFQRWISFPFHYKNIYGMI